MDHVFVPSTLIELLDFPSNASFKTAFPSTLRSDFASLLPAVLASSSVTCNLIFSAPTILVKYFDTVSDIVSDSLFYSLTGTSFFSSISLLTDALTSPLSLPYCE